MIKVVELFNKNVTHKLIFFLSLILPKFYIQSFSLFYLIRNFQQIESKPYLNDIMYHILFFFFTCYS